MVVDGGFNYLYVWLPEGVERQVLRVAPNTDAFVLKRDDYETFFTGKAPEEGLVLYRCLPIACKIVVNNRSNFLWATFSPGEVEYRRRLRVKGYPDPFPWFKHTPAYYCLLVCERTGEAAVVKVWHKTGDTLILASDIVWRCYDYSV